MGVVVFVVGSATGKVDGLFSLDKVSQEVVIKELGSVIRIEAEQGERQRQFDMLDLFEDAGFAFAPDGPLFGPPGGQIDAVNAVGKHPGQRFSTMGHGISFEKTGAGLIPLVGLDGDMFS